MTIQEDVRSARALGMSRKALATLSGLTEGKIWRIETKGNATDAERDALQPQLDAVLIHDVSRRRPQQGATHAFTIIDEVPAQVLVDPPITPIEPQVSNPIQPAESSSVSIEPPPVVVDWPALQAVAREAEGREPVQIGCGHTDLQHGVDDPCRTHPRNLDFRLVSNSEVQTFKDCRRRWWLAYYRGLQLTAQSHTGARAIGNRLHRALEAWYVPAGRAKTDPRHALERLIVADWTLVVQSHNGEQDVPPDLRKKFTDEANLERVMLEGYVQHLADTGIDAELRVISSEAYVEADLTKWSDPEDTKPIKLIGRLDVRVQREHDGVRLFMDHKSVQNFTEPAALLPLDEQMLTYHFLEWLNTDDAEERCDGALYNMLRKVKRSPQAKPPFYSRIEVRHNQHELDSFKHRLMGTITHMRDAETALDAGVDHHIVAYPRPSRDCRWKCDFFMVCGMFDDGSRAEDMLSQYYVKHDPLEYYDNDQGGIIA